MTMVRNWIDGDAVFSLGLSFELVDWIGVLWVVGRYVDTGRGGGEVEIERDGYFEYTVCPGLHY